MLPFDLYVLPFGVTSFHLLCWGGGVLFCLPMNVSAVISSRWHKQILELDIYAILKYNQSECFIV